MIRLDRFLSEGMNVSRSDAKRLLSSGAVFVDGARARSGSIKVDPEQNRVTANGAPVVWQEHVYLLMNKPLGVVSSTDDPDSRTVLDLVPPDLLRAGLFPAGRLDKYSEGMLILTDDGDFAHRILAPRHHLPKTYEVTLDAPIIDDALVAEFGKGVYLGGGERSSPAILVPLGADRARVTIYEGIYHQVRRMFDQNGAHVTRLVRVQIGGLPLDPALAPGEVRPFTPEELSLLQQTEEPHD
jgi:16S rRNA pseudouridine516 synthase